MKIRAINNENIEELYFAFTDFLRENGIEFAYTDLTEENGELSFLFCNDPENARSVDFDSSRCIGLETEYIAKEILQPVLPRLKEFARLGSLF
ncbi:hypothetical protein [Bacillus massiliglaciei]|uniref:hypothetical protein n=1 Tax=Bacillus massiliglaciei TaxID=1816693 RepID=UPI000DA630F3|nr:hypothetical protein [Bacillus massiliglaciei]